jgi:hypothetical protein
VSSFRRCSGYDHLKSAVPFVAIIGINVSVSFNGEAAKTVIDDLGSLRRGWYGRS